jgi:NADH-quinone oxidoreductase subunit M
MWLSVGLALTSYGITLRCIEARVGRIDLNRYYGLYSHMPTMAAFFLLTGLASVGFPCTIGFIAGELLIESAMNFSPWIGWIVVLATALNGIAVMRAYFRIFTGTKHPTTIPMHSQFEERFAIVGLSLLILAGGLYPQPEVESSYQAAIHLLEDYHRAGDHGLKKEGSVIGPAAEASPAEASPAEASPTALN